MFKNLGIVGTGKIGTGIAELAALCDIDVQLYDVNETILRRSLESIKANLRKAMNLGRFNSDKFTSVIGCIRTRTSLADLGHCDCIIEAVIEDIRVKRDLFKHLDANTKSTAVIASATSSLSITSIASLTRNPERVVGAHFLHPVDTTELVEVVKGYKTNDVTIEQVIAFVKMLGKTPIIVKDTPGFIVSRVSYPFFSEALRVLGENIADAAQIDRIMKIVGGFTTGPFEGMDQTGIDTALSFAQSLYNQSFYETRFRPHPILKQMVESGLMGKKSGKGFYGYEDVNVK